ncbi:MAG: hypothetical protein PVI01_09810 [Gemmatimonadales bacterium]
MIRIIRLFLALLAALLLACTDGLQPVPFQGIAGGILYRGTPPDSTEWVRLGVFSQVPVTTVDFLAFSAVSDPLPLEPDSVSYLLGLETGLYRWLPVVWKQADVPIPDGLRILGWYTASDQPIGDPAQFLIQEDAAIEGIDLIADFDRPLTLEEALEALK